MTKDEWKRVQEALTSLMNKVELKIDGYDITVCLLRVSAYKNSIALYVNGVFKGKWLMEDCEERRRFVQMRKRSIFTAKDVKGLSKKAQKEMLSKKIEYYQNMWTSFGGLRGHLTRNNESIELVSISFE